MIRKRLHPLSVSTGATGISKHVLLCFTSRSFLAALSTRKDKIKNYLLHRKADQIILLVLARQRHNLRTTVGYRNMTPLLLKYTEKGSYFNDQQANAWAKLADTRLSYELKPLNLVKK